MKNFQRIAVLITCHNRREKTLKCLTSLYEARLPEAFYLDVYLVDDGSTDGTSDAVCLHFPDVKIIAGNGNLFWNKGMRLAWETAAKNWEYDFYLWLNDDTIIDKDAISELLDCYEEALKQEKLASIIVGTCRNDLVSEIFSYGGRTETGPVIPNGKLQKSKFINGNLVLIPKGIYTEIGNLSPLYTHAIGDNDYGLRAIEKGFNCYITKKYIAVCPVNELASWCNPKTPVLKRIKLLYSPKGVNLNEYIIFLKKHKRNKWLISIIKVYLKALFPKIYKYLSGKSLSI